MAASTSASRPLPRSGMPTAASPTSSASARTSPKCRSPTCGRGDRASTAPP